jgi:hypothetical protein
MSAQNTPSVSDPIPLDQMRDLVGHEPRHMPTKNAFEDAAELCEELIGSAPPRPAPAAVREYLLDPAARQAARLLARIPWPRRCGFCRIDVEPEEADAHWRQDGGVSRCRHREGRTA